MNNQITYRIDLETREAGIHFIGKEYYTLGMAARWYCYYEAKYDDGNHVVRLYAYRDDICIAEIDVSLLYNC